MAQDIAARLAIELDQRAWHGWTPAQRKWLDRHLDEVLEVLNGALWEAN